ncbi:MAG: hypothetical protein ABIY48_05245, partial [Acidimicrobiales bacterium]
MTTEDRARSWYGGGRRWRAARAVALAVVVMSLLGSCRGDGGAVDEVRDQRGAPVRGAIPTIAGGVHLGNLEPTTVLVGSAIAFGAPLPSQQAAADAFVDDPEVHAALARRVYLVADGRHLADVVVLVLDGTQIFDDGVLAGFMRGAVGAMGGGAATDVLLAGQTVLRAGAADSSRLATGFRTANLLVIATGPSQADVDLTVTRQLEARARGEVGAPTPVTPLVPLGADAAFVPVPTVAFAVIPPPETEPGPVPPPLPGATAVQGRYGVVAGERRTVVWAFTVDAGAYPSAEALEPAMHALVAAGGAGVAPAVTEVGDRIVYSSVGAPGSPSAQVFRHKGLVLLVQGDRPDQVDAVTTAWIAA